MLSLRMQCENVTRRVVNWQCRVLRWSKDICKRITTFLRSNTVAFALFHLLCHSFLYCPSVLKTRVKKLWIAGKHSFCFGGDSRERLFPAPAFSTTSQTEDVPGRKRKTLVCLSSMYSCTAHSVFYSILKSRVEKAFRVPLPRCNSTLIPGGVFQVGGSTRWQSNSLFRSYFTLSWKTLRIGSSTADFN